MDKIAPYWKAVVGFVAPGAGNLLLAMQDGSHMGSTISGNEWFGALLISIITSAGVFAVENKKQPPRA